MTTWRTERTGWRDAALSERHGHWGFNCPAVDLDFVMMEYNHGKPCALVEYKHVNATRPNVHHATYRALVDLADNYKPGPLPCFVAVYDNTQKKWQFLVIPLNDRARQHFKHCEDTWIEEARFVKGLFLLRKSVLSDEDEAVIKELSVSPTKIT